MNLLALMIGISDPDNDVYTIGLAYNLEQSSEIFQTVDVRPAKR